MLTGKRAGGLREGFTSGGPVWPGVRWCGQGTGDWGPLGGTYSIGPLVPTSFFVLCSICVVACKLENVSVCVCVYVRVSVSWADPWVGIVSKSSFFPLRFLFACYCIASLLILFLGNLNWVFSFGQLACCCP